MTQEQVKKQITHTFITIGGIGFVNTQHIADEFLLNAHQEELFIAIAEIGANQSDDAVYPGNVVLLGEGSCAQVYINAMALVRLHSPRYSLIGQTGDLTLLFSRMCDRLLLADGPSYESLVEQFEAEAGISSVPVMMTAAEVMH